MLETETEASGSSAPGLLTLDNFMLIRLADQLNAPDRLRLAEVCPRLKVVCHDHSLWKDVEVDQPMNVTEIRRKILPLLHARTHRIAIKGLLYPAMFWAQSVSPALLLDIAAKCPQLKEIKLTACYLDISQVTVHKFPKSLERLLLPDCDITNQPRNDVFFSEIHQVLPSLRQLDLSGCSWVSNHSLMAMCKLACLEELSLRGCCKIGSCFAHTALACRFGFRVLKKLDLRDTGISSSEVSAFGRLPQLTHLKMGRTSAPEEDDLWEITNGGVFSICNMPGDRHVSKLQCLSLTHLPKVSNQVMTRLGQSLPELRELDVSGTKISALGAAVLLETLPECKVILDPLPLVAGEVEAPVDVEDPQEQFPFIQLQP